jgi:hypothetical protein
LDAEELIRDRNLTRTPSRRDIRRAHFAWLTRNGNAPAFAFTRNNLVVCLMVLRGRCAIGAPHVFHIQQHPTETRVTNVHRRHLMRAKRFLRLGILFAGLACASAAPAHAQNVSDETGPAIGNVTFSTTFVDTTSGPKNVAVTVTATDDLSGVNYMWLYLRTTASDQPGNQTFINCFVSTLVSGTRLDGTFTGTCSFPQYTQSGNWFVYQSYAYDMVGNYNALYNNGSQLSVASQFISVTAPSPVPVTGAIPTLLSLTLDPPAVDTSNGTQSIMVTARIASSNGSFSFGSVGLRDPSSMQFIGANFSSGNRISGDAFDGLYRTTVSLPRYSRSGAWVWSYAQISNTSNQYSYYYNAIDGVFNNLQTYNGATSTSSTLGASGPPLTPAFLTVQSTPSDMTAPTLINFEINPSSIDVSTSGKTITVTTAVADDLSGVSFGCFVFVSPNGQQSRSGCFNAPSSNIQVFFPQFSQAGNWFLNYMYLYDRVGNYRYLYPGDLSQLGFPTSIQISSGVSVQNATGYVGGVVTLAATLTKLGVPAAGKTLTFTLFGTSVGSAVTDTTGVATLQDVSLAGIQVGTHVNAIAARFAGDAEQAAASGQATLIVTNKLSQTITFAPLSDRSLAGSPFTLQASASSGLAVTFAATGVCSVAGTSVTLTGIGSCTIIASQPGNSLFDAAPSISRTFNVVSRSDQTITFPAIADRRYGDASFTVAPTSSSGLPVTLQASGNCSVNGSSVTVGAVGSCQITASQPGNDTYNAAADVVRSFAIAAAPLIVTGSNADAVLNGTLPAFGATYTGFVAGENSSALGGVLNCASAPGAIGAVGTHAINCSGLTSSNYAISYKPGTLYVRYSPSTAACYGSAGRSILQPIDADGGSVFKKGSTVPAKFRVCDANGVSIGSAGVVTSFRLVQVLNGTVGDVDESVDATTPDQSFRWDASAQQWIFNINTKSLSASRTYVYDVTLNDGTSLTFRYGLR